jgi:hypothetical protein
MLGVLGILGILKKVPFWIWIILLGAGYFAWSQNQIGNLKAEITLSQLARDSTTQVNDSLFARITVDGIEKDSLAGALEAADELNAELVAAARIRVQPRPASSDTVLVPVVTEDSTRIATIVETLLHEDSTEVGTLDATITAPPFPADIGFEYEFIPAPIEFEIGLLRVDDDNAIFTVTYSGGSADISAPYARLPAKPPRAYAYIDGMYNVTGGFASFRGGTHLRIFNWLGTFAELSQDATEIAEGGNSFRFNLGGRLQFTIWK